MTFVEWFEKYGANISAQEKFMLDSGLICLSAMIDKTKDDMRVKFRPQHLDLSYIESALRVGRALMGSGAGKGTSEKDSCDMLTLLWDVLMPEHELIKREFTLPSGKRIDFVALNKEDGKYLIIEAKNSKNSCSERKGVPQVLGYVEEFDKLHGVKSESLLITKGDIYDDSVDSISWYEFGIFEKFAVPPTHICCGDLFEISKKLNIKPRVIDGITCFHYDVLSAYINLDEI